jgi:hypothetical protein
MSASNDTIIRRYEEKVEMLEREKALMIEKANNQRAPQGTFEEKLELALTFLANPWKLWESGNIHARRITLKLAFTGPILYCRNKGARTPDLSLPFNALGHDLQRGFFYGAPEENNLEPSDFDVLLPDLERWSELLKSEREVMHKLSELGEAASNDGLDAEEALSEPSTNEPSL